MSRDSQSLILAIAFYAVCLFLFGPGWSLLALLLVFIIAVK